MRDLLYLIGTVAFFALIMRYAYALRRLGGGSGVERGR